MAGWRRRERRAGAGELLAFGKGYEYGLMAPGEVMQAIVLAMPLEDAERDGHLSRGRNGDPVPGRGVPAGVFEKLASRASAAAAA